ncbi:MAG: SDR family oxidoreductase [Oligoflexia bacterium]|nr:SDR family oxidoreductase [Oligoflexia bacterium]
MTQKRSSKPVVLVTGASSGIGLALAHQLFENPDYRVVVSARKESLQRLRALASTDSPRFLVRALDINRPEERRQLIDEISRRWGGVDILINNAGVAYRAVVEEMTEQEERLQLQTNYLSPMDLARLVLPHMRQQRWGKIVNVSSVGGMMAMPTMGSYSASKFALEGASEALWYELKPWGINVMLVQPGFVRSHSFRRVRIARIARAGMERVSAYAPYYRHMGAFIGKLMSRAIATPDSIAATIINSLDHKNPPLRIPATIDAYIFSWMRRFLPRRLYHALLFWNLPGIRDWGKLPAPEQLELDAGIPVQAEPDLRLDAVS